MSIPFHTHTDRVITGDIQGRAPVEGSMMNRGGGGRRRSGQGTLLPQGASGVGANAGLGLHYFARLKLLRLVTWLSRFQRTYSQGLRTLFLVELILCAGVRERHFLFGRFSASGMGESRVATPFEEAGARGAVCAGVRGRQEAAAT